MNSYDVIRYPTTTRVQTHPDVLAAVATLHGLEPAPVERCRVLEIACGTGTNVVSMAYGLPHSEFTGIDLAAAPIEEGCKRIGTLGLKNIRLLNMDLGGITPQFGEFDYIVTHGVYSWVPPPVRDRILAVCRANLAPHGVAYVSYNAYPGSHIRRIVRDIVSYHVSGLTDPEVRSQQARAMLGLMVEAQAGHEMATEFRLVLERDPGAILHDDLEEFNDPVYFHEFAAHAAKHDLQFLSEATMVPAEARIPEKARRALPPLDSDPIRRQQYLDFMTMKRFRETLLCHREAVLTPPAPGRVCRLLASSKARPAGPGEPDGTVEYGAGPGAVVKTANPLVKAALGVLSGCWPRRLPFDELLRRARETAAGGAGAFDDSALAVALWDTCRCGLVELHAHPGCFVARAGEYPVASAITRLDLAGGAITSTLDHQTLRVEESAARRLIEALDGSRNRAALAAELGAAAAEIEEGLAKLARLPLLVA